MHNIHQRNTDDGGQAMSEELRHVQMSRWIKWTTIRVMRQRAVELVHNISLQKQVARVENNVYTYKSWRSNTIAHIHGPNGVSSMDESMSHQTHGVTKWC